MANENVTQDHRQPPAKTEYEGASKAWVAAKEKLIAAQQARAQAEVQQAQALEAEQECWNTLQDVAGRGLKPVDVPASKPYLSPYPSSGGLRG